MTSVVIELLKKMTKKELFELAHQKGITVPVEWSEQLLVDLLSLNVTGNDINQKKTTNYKIKYEGRKK